MRKTSTIKLSSFGEKHLSYTRRAWDFDKAEVKSAFNIAEGAIRSSKTLMHCILFATYLEVTSDRLHLATGSSIHNAKLNIGDCNGFGLEHLFRGRCKWGKYKDNEALFIWPQPKDKENVKIIIFAGGGKADSYKGILGNSYGGWIATEINEHFISDDPRTCFIDVAQGRQLAALSPFVLWDLNPCYPQHPIYERYIDNYSKSGIANYGHFTIYDNTSLSKERLAEVERRYVPGEIRHTRDILGQRCVSEGLIFKKFADTSNNFFIDWHKTPNHMRPVFKHIFVGVDPGGNKSSHGFCAIGITHNYDKLIALASETHVATDTDADFISKKFNDFVMRVEHKYGSIEAGWCDSEAQTIKNTLTHNGKIVLRNSIKNKIKDRIDCLSMLIAQDRFFYTEDCDTLKRSLCSQVWDSKHPDERLDDGVIDIHSADCFEYSWERYIKHFIREVRTI